MPGLHVAPAMPATRPGMPGYAQTTDPKGPDIRVIKSLLAALLVMGGLAACTGSDRTFGERVRDTVDPPSGPVESAGRAVDRAVDRVKPN